METRSILYNFLLPLVIAKEVPNNYQIMIITDTYHSKFLELKINVNKHKKFLS